jgi:phage RecT family recombinase
MSNAPALQGHRAPSRVEIFMAKVITPEDRASLKAALPEHIPFDRFERNLSNALMNEPKLLACNPREVFREVAKIAALGLLIDAQLGEAYLIAGRKGPQARIGYRGLIKLARQSGDVSMIYAHEVYEHDEIDCVLGDEKKLHHKPKLFGKRGEIVGYYAVIKFKSGETDFEPMTPEQINEIRDRSDGYKAFKAGSIKDTPWVSSYDEMAKKTCIRRLAKRCPLSPDLAQALSIEDRAEHPLQIGADPQQLSASERLAQKLAAGDPGASGFSEGFVESELQGTDGEAITEDGEIIEHGAEAEEAEGGATAATGAENEASGAEPAPAQTARATGAPRARRGKDAAAKETIRGTSTIYAQKEFPPGEVLATIEGLGLDENNAGDVAKAITYLQEERARAASEEGEEEHGAAEEEAAQETGANGLASGAPEAAEGPADHQRPSAATRDPWFAAGKKAAADGMSRRAVPPELRAEDRTKDLERWRAGYDAFTPDV